jgi:hypothetical protein
LEALGRFREVAFDHHKPDPFRFSKADASCRWAELAQSGALSTHLIETSGETLHLASLHCNRQRTSASQASVIASNHYLAKFDARLSLARPSVLDLPLSLSCRS